MQPPVAFLFIGLTINTASAAQDWNYLDKGPSKWATLFPQHCAGRSQSPIDLIASIAVTPQTDPGAIVFNGYDTKAAGTIKNNGHSVSFSFDNMFAPTISGGRLPAGNTFQFLSLHWHWGTVSSKGGEHHTDGVSHPLELHIIHWNMKYGDFSNAIKYADGLAVLGFFYEISTADNGDLKPILDKLSAVALTRKYRKRNNQDRNINTRNGRSSESLANFCDYYAPPNAPLCKEDHATDSTNTAAVASKLSLNQFLPTTGAGDEYFYYSGSLTTPTCDEIVLWTNFLSRLMISESQLQMFRTLKDGTGTGQPIIDNHRPPMPLNGRALFKRSLTAPATVAMSGIPDLTIGAAIGAVVMYMVLGSGVLSSLLTPTPNQRISKEFYSPVPQGFNENYRKY